ncbi:MAG: ABC transporter permease [Verrucomicrobiaceae bacterium]
MISIALQMLRADRAKYFAMILAVSLAVFLMQNQASILVSIFGMTGAQIRDVSNADLWVMEQDTECFDQAKPVPVNALLQVRSTPGVQWALPLIKFDTYARADSGKLSVATILGVDDSSLVGLPPRMIKGDPEAIRERGTVMLDPGGASLLYPDIPASEVIGRSLRIGSETLRVAALSNASAPFTGFPLLHMTRTTALTLKQAEDRDTTFILGSLQPGVPLDTVRQHIRDRFQLQAHSAESFMAASRDYYAKQGIPQLFGLTIIIGLIVGTAITGQTFMMFVKENARHLAVLKVVGVTSKQFAGMLCAQATLVLLLGSAFGTALASLSSDLAREEPFLRGVYLPVFVVVLTCGALSAVTYIAVFFSFRTVQQLEPASVFR